MITFISLCAGFIAWLLSKIHRRKKRVKPYSYYQATTQKHNQGRGPRRYPADYPDE